jgi:hypothetical protein
MKNTEIYFISYKYKDDGSPGGIGYKSTFVEYKGSLNSRESFKYLENKISIKQKASDVMILGIYKLD